MGLAKKHPVVNVGYNDAIDYCNWLKEKFGGNWRLPREAEWEYAARGGNESKGYEYSGGNQPDAVGWYKGIANKQTNEIGQKKENELGIYDMSGNVCEWTSDWYFKDQYEYGTTPKKRNEAIDTLKVVRGGSWFTPAYRSRVAYRNYSNPVHTNELNGFRVVYVK